MIKRVRTQTKNKAFLVPLFACLIASLRDLTYRGHFVRSRNRIESNPDNASAALRTISLCVVCVFLCGARCGVSENTSSGCSQLW
jgi:hypothetical protein